MSVWASFASPCPLSPKPNASGLTLTPAFPKLTYSIFLTITPGLLRPLSLPVFG